MRVLDSRRRAARLSSVLVVALVAVGLGAGCSPRSEPADVGQLQETSNGRMMTVPALWAAKRADGSYDGGVEPTQVIVRSDTDQAGYSVDLASIEAKGAGPSWEAATASAAAFATLFSGADPSRVALDFTITGPIDGPSAGGLLTCGLLAAFSGVSFRPGVTMTGTISPDGSIGVVGYIPRKVQAAAEAGFRTVIIPAEAVRDPVVLPDGRTLQDYAKSLDVTLVPVWTVGEAFATLTGRPSFYPEAAPASLTPGAEAAARTVAEGAVSRLRGRIASVPADIDGYALGLSRRALSAAQTALDDGDVAAAYGQATFGSNRLARAVGAANVTALLDRYGLDATRTALRASADDLIDRAWADIARLRAVAPNGIEAQASAPTIISWPVYALAAVVGVRDHLAAASQPDVLVEMGRIIAEEDLSLRESLPDAERILMAGPSAPLAPNAVAELNAYRRLFNEAANANARYATVVLKEKAGVDSAFTDQGLSAAITALDDAVGSNEPSASDTFGDAATGTAVAMTRFWFTAALVTAAQAYGTDRRPSADTRRAFASQAQDAAVAGSSGTVDSIAALVASQGIRPDLPIWSAEWSSSVALAYRSTPDATEANWLALSELWYDVMQMVMLRALATN